jgi:GDSL-like Lipase/Acylhydrolase family
MMFRRGKYLRVQWGNILLAFASAGAAYLAAEALFSLWGLRYVPLRLHADLPVDIRIFAQSSKSNVLPLGPVVLLGDSYAQGFGDWLLQADPDRNGPFHSGHVIHALTGRDVITLGQGGAGSPEGMAMLPAIAYARTEDAWYLRLPRPDVAVVYFFEGNDLNNNTRFLQRRVEVADGIDLTGAVDRALAAYAATPSQPTDLWHHFPLFQFSYNIVRRVSGFSASAAQNPSFDNGGSTSPSDPPNVVAIAGQPVQLPPSLQSPSLELTAPELERAVLVFERSLAFLRQLFPGTPVLVAYLPSPLSSYRILAPEVSIESYMPGRSTRYPRERVAEYSDLICGLIRTATVAHETGFLDIRPAIRAASARATVHGPRDFNHFNRNGMEALGEAVAGRLNRPLAQEACSQGVL